MQHFPLTWLQTFRGTWPNWKYKAQGLDKVQMLQPRSYCLKLPNVSSSCSHTEVSFIPKLLTSALSKAMLQSLLYTHIYSFKEQVCIHSSVATVLCQLFIQVVEDVQITQLNGTERKTWTLKQLHCTAIKTGDCFQI